MTASEELKRLIISKLTMVYESTKRYIKNNRGRILAIVIIWAALSIIFAGWIYYNSIYPSNPGKSIAMVLQNLFETLLFNPVLTIEKMAEKEGFIESLSLIEEAFIHSFSAAVILIPAINLFVVYNIANRFLHIVLSIPGSSKRHLLIVGYNPQVINLLRSSKGEFKTYLWSEKSLSNEQKIELTQLKVRANTNESPLGAQVRTDELRSRFNKLLHKHKIQYILIMHESDAVNIEYYMLLSSCDVCRDRNIHFYVKVDQFASKLTLQEYFDQQLDREDKRTEAQKGKYKPLKMDLRIFNLPMIQAEEVYRVFPMFKGTDKANEYKVHLMIAGDNALAYEMLLMAMNQAVITSDNSIVIDVYGQHTDVLRSKLNERFNPDYVDCIDDTFVISNNHADGRLKIRLFAADLSKEESIDMVKYNNQKNSYTYFICCLENPDDNLHCFRQLKDIFGKIPMVFRMPYTRQMKAYLDEEITGNIPDFQEEWPLPWDDTHFIYLMGSDIEYLRLGNIIDLEEEEKIRDFNYRYADIKAEEEDKDKANTSWNSILYYKRQSNRFLYDHLHNKLYAAAKQSIDFEIAVNEYWGDDKKNTPEKEQANGKAVKENSSSDQGEKSATGNTDEKSKALPTVESKTCDCTETITNNPKATTIGTAEQTASDKQTEANESDSNKEKDNSGDTEAEKSEQLLKSKLISFAETEHRRFCYAYASEGWGYTDGEKKEKLLLHDCLCTWKTLVTKEGTKNKAVYDATSAREVKDRYKKYKEVLKDCK